MMHLIVVYVIGGDSGKREAAVLTGLIWLFAAWGAEIAIQMGYDLEFTKELVKAAMWPVFGWWGIAFGMEHVFANKSRESSDAGPEYEERILEIPSDGPYADQFDPKQHVDPKPKVGKQPTV